MQKIIMIAAFAVLLISLTVSAQPRQSPQDRVKALKERLNLTDDQSVQVEKIFTQAQEKMKNSADRSEFRKIMTDSNDQIEKLLTDKQKTEFKKMQEERMNRMRNRQDNTDKKPDTKTDAKPDTSHQK
jgi:Spy/CpxP family protein refolding chaperone